jgi:hypothetical protein
MSTQEGGEGIQTSDLRFMKRGSQPIELPLDDVAVKINTCKKKIYDFHYHVIPVG